MGPTLNVQNGKQQARNLILTRVDDGTVTVDGNNPLRGRNVMLAIGVLAVRDATHEQIACGGAVSSEQDINEILR